MNWHRSTWNHTKLNFDKPYYLYKNVWSNLTGTWTELLTSGPYTANLPDMAHANQTTLRIYRNACRLIPSMLNRNTTNYQKDYHMTKRNLGQWFRRGKNMRNLTEIAQLHKTTLECVYDSAYCNVEAGIYNTYLFKRPDDNKETYEGIRGINLYDDVKFNNKSKFFEKFVKGSRALQ